MFNYIELAAQLEDFKATDDTLLEKIASLYLMYSYSRCNDESINVPGLAKIASNMHDDDMLALHLGVEMVLCGLEKQEV